MSSRKKRAGLAKLKEQPAVTQDAIPIDLYANIERLEDTTAVRQVAAAGVGLYRTEFLFMNRLDLPDEEEHLASYLQVIKFLGGSPVTIRTADLGADKEGDSNHCIGRPSTNPALGLRGIRLSLRNRELLRPQLGAILRASAFGSVRLMIPMLSNREELFQVLVLIEEIKRELLKRGQRYDENMPVGVMIEVPAAALCAPDFAHHVDFLSIGTNDLIQYALAIDRVNDEVNYLHYPLHPAVLKLIRMILQAGFRAGIPVSLCGEIAGDARYTRLLLGLGLTQFSMHPHNLLEVKRIIRDSHVGNLSATAERILKTSDSAEFACLLHQITQGQLEQPEV